MRMILLLHVTLIGALIWDGPKSTDSASVVTASISPRPTETTELVKRDAWPPQYCGFVGAIQSLGVTCSPHSSCVWNTDYFVVGCCATASKACLFFTSCIDENSPATAADDSLVFTCRGTKTCFINDYPSNYRQWGCGYNATFIALTYSNMSADAATIQQAFIGTKELLAMTTVTATANYTVTATPNSGSSNGVSTATIVGAAIGGSALLVIGAVIIAFLLFRARKNSQPAISSPMSPTSGPPVAGFSPSVTYINKDQFQPVPMGPPSSTEQSRFSQPNHGVYQYPSNPSDTIYQPYRPSNSPGPIVMSPTPREMDARSFRSYGNVPRKPLPGQDDTPPLPSPYH